jgi:hypothetical protein
MNGKDANVGGKYTSFRSEKSNKTGSKNGTISQTWHIGNTSDEMSGIQQSKFIADYLRISYP